MAAILLKGHDAPPDRLTRWMDKNLGWLFTRFNTMFKRRSDQYANGVIKVLGKKKRAIGLYAVLIVATIIFFKLVPAGYIPAQDKQYLIGFAQLPDGASLERTDKVLREMSNIALRNEGVLNAVSFPGLSIQGFSVSSSAGIVFLPLKSFGERSPNFFRKIQGFFGAIPLIGYMIPPAPDYSAQGIANSINMQFGAIKDAFLLVLPPPPVMGLGTTGGFKLQIQDRADLGDEALAATVGAITGRAYGTPGLSRPYSGFQINVPQLFVDIDRTKAKQLGIPITSIFNTMQIYLGSLYINDFNRFGRTYQVIAQADAPFRAHAQDIGKLKVRSMNDEMIPLGSVLNIKQSYGPERAMRYNAYRTADINAEPAYGFSTGQAQAILEQIVRETLPKGMSFEWTDLTYQQILAGDTTMYVFPLCVLLVFLVLAAQYENLTLPLAVILIVPMSLLSAIFGVWLTRGDNNIFTQIGLMVLVGLACKNAILIVEFARELELDGIPPMQAAVQSARLRLRPILMTSFAFIMGVVPLVLSSGAGSEMRHAMGVTVFFGMLGVTFFGLYLTPVFYVALRQYNGKPLKSSVARSLHAESHRPEPPNA